MTSYIFFGGLGGLIFVLATYFSYKILTNFETDAHVAASMFFLRDKESDRTFESVSLMMVAVTLGNGSILVSHYLSIELLPIIGKAFLILAFTGALYFVASVSKITESPNHRK